MVSPDVPVVKPGGAYGVQPRMPARDIDRATNYDFDRDAPAIDKLEYALGLARGEPRMPRAERAFIPVDEGGPELAAKLEDDGYAAYVKDSNEQASAEKAAAEVASA